MGQALSKRGLWVDECVALQEDTRSLGAEWRVEIMPTVITSRALAEEALDIEGRAQSLGQLMGCTAGCSKENSSPPLIPISANQAHTDAHPVWAGCRGPYKVAGCALKRWGGDSLQALHQPGTKKAPRSTRLRHTHIPS